MAKICQKVGVESGVEVIPIVSAFELYRIKQEVEGKMFIQGGERWIEGAHSGAISMAQAWENGASGVILNNSERRLPPGEIRNILPLVPASMTRAVCLGTEGQMEKWGKRLKLDWLIYEPKELIGNREKSVASEKPEIIARMVKATGAPLLVGAGVHSRADVEISLKLGARGVLVSSDVVLAADPEKELRELAEGFLNPPP